MAPKPKTYRFDITPQTSVRATQGDRILFKIGKAKLRPQGLKRLLRLERYNNYKEDVSAIAKQKRFDFPYQGAHIKFYIPCPKSWSKKKKLQYHGSLHTSRPDVDNLTKAIFDSLFSEDKNIADVRISKFWVDFETGWIDIEVSKPDFPEIPRVLAVV